MSNGLPTSRLLLSVALLSATACAGRVDALRLLTHERERLVEMPALVQELAPVEPADAAAFAVGSRDDELVGLRWDPDAPDGAPQPSWRRATAVTQPALIAGQVVVWGEGARLSALDAASGEPLWSLPARGAELIAVADDGTFTALTLRHPRTSERSLAVLDRAGRELLELETQAPLGVPALLRGTLIVPWGAFVSAVDVSTRAEVARARVDAPFQHATWLLGQLFLGGPPWVELGVAPSPPYTLARRPLPGRVIHGGPERIPGPVADITRLYVQPTRAERDDARAASGDVYLATYGRVALGVEARRGTLSWVLALPGRALAAVPLAGAFAVCDDTGTLRWLDADGAERWQAQLFSPRRRARVDVPLTACSLSAGSSHTAERSASPRDGARAREPLLEQLTRVLSLADRELLSAQRFLSRELAARPEPEATRALIELATRRSADPILQADAEDLLATRRNGAELMLAALAPTRPSGPDPLALAPLGPLADALGALGEQRAAPLLAEQLNHPGHSAGALARAATALEQLAGEAEYANLSVFFSLHRTIADQPERVEAVMAVGRTLLRIGGERGRTLVQQAARDPLTVPEVRQRLTRALEGAPTSAAPPVGRYGAVALARKGG